MNSSNAIPTLVMKFGGTSVGSTKAMAEAAQIVQDAGEAWPRRVVVVSALSGITDLLIRQASTAATGGSSTLLQTAEEINQRHNSIAEELIDDLSLRAQVRQDITHLLGEFTQLCQAIGVLGEATPRAMDAVASLGERMCIRLFSAVLTSRGCMARAIESTQLIVTDDQFQSANPDFEATTQSTRKMLEPVLSQNCVPVVTGFIGATPSGIITTLGRGGSDFSAAIIGSVLPANEVWIWTDVDGVMTADPRIVPNARTIPVISYREVSELAYFGAKVLHPKTIRPVIEAGIGLRVCNTFNPTNPGTRLVDVDPERGEQVIKAVTAFRGHTLITIEGRGMLGVPGVAARAFGTVAAMGVSVPLFTQSSSEQSICFAVPSDTSPKVVSALQKTFSQEIERRDIDRVFSSVEVVIITVVGAGISVTPGVAGQVFTVLGNLGVNIIAIASGSSEVSVSLVVDAKDYQVAVRGLHDLIV